MSAEEPRFKWNALGLENQESFSKVLSGVVSVRSHPEHEWVALRGFLHI